MTAERTAERLPIYCLSTVCRTPHTPLCVAQHRCCARLGSLDLAGYSKTADVKGTPSTSSIARCRPGL
jgi:hypothetical protein